MIRSAPGDIKPGSAIVPIGPVSRNYDIPSGKSLEDLLDSFKDCIIIRAGSGFVAGPDAWFSVLCEKVEDLSALSDNTRIDRQLQKRVSSLKEIRTINPIDFIQILEGKL
jgi:hypothetical protein